MIASPIAERELRIAARSPRTYRRRRDCGAVAVLAFFALYWRFGISGAAGGLSRILCLLCFIYAAAAGVIFAADSISAEKREGTLGLLFLTRLRARDIIIGNAAASSLEAVYGLLASFPILGIGTMLGGFSAQEFFRVCLALLATLLFSLSLALLASACSTRHITATGRAALGMCGFVVVLPGFCFLLRRLSPSYSSGWAYWINLFSPATTFDLAGFGLSSGMPDFWISLLCIGILTVVMLAGACLALRFVSRDRETRTGSWMARQLQRAERLRARCIPFHPRRSIEGNPFGWLASRKSHEAAKFLLMALAIAAAAAWVENRFFARMVLGPFQAFLAFLTAWLIATGALNILLMFKLAALATHRFAEDRKLGALELLLVTPMRHPTILRGQIGALFRQFAGPAGGVLFLNFLLLWSFLTLFGMEQSIPGGARGVLRAALQTWSADAPASSWQVFLLSAGILEAIFLIALCWIVVASVGMWIGLRARRPATAPWATLALCLLPPLPLFAGIVTAADWMGFSQDPFLWVSFCLILAFVLSSANSGLLFGWSWWNLLRNFRKTAASRYDVPAPAHWWFMRMNLARISMAVMIPLCAIALFYRVERWRGVRAWTEVQTEFSKRGEELTTSIAPPPEIARDQNFAAIELFAPLFEYRFDPIMGAVWKNLSARNDLMTITLSGRERSWWGIPATEPRSNWEAEKATDFAEWEKFFRKNPVFTSSCSTGNPPEIVVQALSLFSPELEEIQQASSRRLARFPIHYAEGWGAFVPHRTFLYNVADILQLRACALLRLDQSAAALRDVNLSLRLADALKGEVGLDPRRVREKIVLRSIQPVWEGLLEHRWKAAELEEIQRAFDIDFLAGYAKGLRGEAMLQADFWERFARADRQELQRWGFTPGMCFAATLYPIGWKLLNQAGAYRLTAEYLVGLVDPASHRVFASRANAIHARTRESGVALDPMFRMTAPRNAQSYVDAVCLTARAQVAADLARIACGLERFRQSEGELPLALENLQPRFLAKLPCDPLSGKSYRYRRERGGFVLYSIGWNEEDDGGQPASAIKAGWEVNPRQGDWAWSCRKPITAAAGSDTGAEGTPRNQSD